MRIALVLLVWCNQSSPPPNAPPPPRHATRPACPEEWFLLRAVQHCADIRGGWSGFWVLEVADGPHAGQRAMAAYGAMPVLVGKQPARNDVSRWNIAKAITFETLAPSSSWPNNCVQLGGAITYDGSVEGVEGFIDEAAARRALAARCAR